MKIKELYIRSFGKLKDYKLTLSDGVNVLFGSNEAGKTTIFNFILAMLYGLANSRGKELSDNARKKYMTWGENKIGGTMTLEHQGTVYVIDRTFGKTKAGDNLTFTNVTLGEQVSLPNGREVGEYLFDLDEKSFRGTCFIGQLSKDDVCDNDGVRTKLSNLSNVGDASYSFDDVFGRLKNASLEITRKTSTGKIYPLENKKNDLESRNRIIDNELNALASIDEENKTLEARANELSAEISATEIRINKAKSQKKLLEYKKAIDNNKRVEVAYTQYQRATENITRKGFTADREYADTLNSLIKKRDDARLKYEYEEKVLENEQKALEILASSKPEKKNTAIIYHVIATIILAVLFVCVLLLKHFLLSVILGTVFIVSCILLVCSVVKKKTDLKSEGDELSAQKDKVNLLIEQVGRLKSEYEQCNEQFNSKFLLFFEREQIAEAQEQINALSSMLDCHFESKIKYDAVADSAVSDETLEQMRTDIDETDLNSDFDNVDIDKLVARKAVLSDERLHIEKALLVNQERIKGMSKAQAERENNLSVIVGINEKIKAYQYAGECLDIAKQGLEKAQKEMQQQFAPDVSRLVAEILSSITDGKYSQMILNSKLQATVVDERSGATYEDGFMSAGTLDQIYLAIRFAMVSMIFDGKDFPTICMDDALLNFDSDRMKKASEYISLVLSEKAQVLFFTCRDTERDCFPTANLLTV